MIINVEKCHNFGKAKTRKKNANKRWNFDSTGACTIKRFTNVIYGFFVIS
jgi:hypothetical protein